MPVVLGRGAYQLSGYLDFWLSTFVAAGALGAIGYAQTLYLLPISLFGMSVAASELPELSRISRTELDTFLTRVSGSVRQIFYLIIPTVVGYLGFGYLVVGAFYQTGQFGTDDTWQVTFVLAAYSLGMVATTAGRLLQNAFYALNDTKTPARIAVWRVAVSAVIGAGADVPARPVQRDRTCSASRPTATRCGWARSGWRSARRSAPGSSCGGW